MNMADASRICLNYFSFIGRVPFLRSITRLIKGNKATGLQKEVFGLSFYNPVGLGAGLDIKGKVYNDLSNLGFSFVEVGPVGSEEIKEVIKHVQKDPQDDILAICIDRDFLEAFTLAYDFFDFFVLDLSDDPSVEYVEPLLEARLGELKYKPIVIKLPDFLTKQEIESFADYSLINNIDAIEIRSLDHLNHIYRYTNARLPLIANSHIDTPERASEALNAGASLVEIRTGLVKEGPGIIADTLKYLQKNNIAKNEESSSAE